MRQRDDGRPTSTTRATTHLRDTDGGKPGSDATTTTTSTEQEQHDRAVPTHEYATTNATAGSKHGPSHDGTIQQPRRYMAATDLATCRPTNARDVPACHKPK